MKSTLFAFLPLVSLAFAGSAYKGKSTGTALPVRSDGSALSSCSRQTVTSTKMEKVTVTVDPHGGSPHTVDVTSTSTKYVKTTMTIRPSRAPAASSGIASSLRWSSSLNATYHASSSSPAPSSSKLPDFSIIGQEKAGAASTSSTTNPTSKTAPSSAASSAPVPTAKSGSETPISSYAAGSKRGDATFYGGNTSGGMCSFTGYTIPSGIYGTALSDGNWDSANACGQCVSVTGPDGTTKITAMVVDQCPGCGTNHLDLFPDAFAKLANPNKGVISVSWDYVPCGITSSLSLKNKSGTSKYWFSMQVMNANVGVTKLEVSTDGGASWKATKRQPYNFFENSAGFGTDSVDVRVTGVNGKTVVVKGVSIASGSVKTASGNL